MDILIQNGANIYAIDSLGRTPLHDACSGGYYESIVLLINRGSNIHAIDSLGRTPLHDACSDGYYASRDGSYKSIVLLINRGSNIHTKDHRGVKAYHFIPPTLVDIQLLQILTTSGANFNELCGERPLFHKYFFHNDEKEILDYLIDIHGADINSKDSKGNSILSRLVLSGTDMKKVKYIVSKGIDINARNNKGETTLTIAQEMRNELVPYLLNQGAKK